MTKLLVSPVQEGLSVEFGDEIVRTQLDGGFGRRRRDIIGASEMVSVQWIVDTGAYQYLRNFFRGATRSGALAFEIDLIIEGVCEERTAYFMPGTFRLDEMVGNKYRVTAVLELEPTVVDEDYLAALAMLYAEYGGTDTETIGFINPLETLVNDDLDAISA